MTCPIDVWETEHGEVIVVGTHDLDKANAAAAAHLKEILDSPISVAASDHSHLWAGYDWETMEEDDFILSFHHTSYYAIPVTIISEYLGDTP